MASQAPPSAALAAPGGLGRSRVALPFQRCRIGVPSREDGPSSSGRGAPQEKGTGAPGRWVLAPAAYLRPQGDVQATGRMSDVSSSSSSSGAATLPPVGSSAAAPPQPAGALALVQELGGASLLQLVGAWDQLAARLPPQAGAGRGADVILEALKVAVAYAPAPPPAAAAAAAAAGDARRPGVSRPVARALSLASRLADIAASGLPIDAESIAAGILAEVLLSGQHAPSHAPWQAVPGSASGAGPAGSGSGALTLRVIEERVGPIVAQLVYDIQRARQLPARVELLDDTAASALRELCLSFYDVRATAVEVVARLDLLCSPDQPSYEQQVAALEALQMYAPMGHALGLGPVAQQLEDRCFQILFPESYVRTAAWLREEAVANAHTLQRCKAALAAAVHAQPQFAELAAGLELEGRQKSLFSTLKKLLRLGNTAAGGRAREQLYDLIGMRAIVTPHADLPPEAAEALAAEACYLVRDAACSLWECLPDRAKDYIAAPKSNGYQSLHSTVRVRSATLGASQAGCAGSSGGGEAPPARSHTTLELQIRTQAMHDRAERGEAAHGAYKGGLDAGQALKLKSMTDAVLQRAAAAAAPLAGPAGSEVTAGGSTSGGGNSSSPDAAAESLFRHMDQNGDGRISLEELQFALQELGVHEVRAQSRAAAELLQLASADEDAEGGAAEGGGGGAAVGSDGTIGFEAFMAFQRRVGLLQALSAVDHQQAHLLEVAVLPAAAETANSSSSMDEASLFSDPSRAALSWASGSWDSGDASSSGGGSRLAAGACRAAPLRRQAGASGGLAWRPAAQAGSRRPGMLVARAFIETSSSAAFGSSSDSADCGVDVQQAAASAGSLNGSAASSHRVGGGALNGVVALHDRQQRGDGSSSSSSSNGTSINGSSHHSSSHDVSSHGAGSNGAGSSHNDAASRSQRLLRKPKRRAHVDVEGAAAGARAPPAEDEAEVSEVDRQGATAVWKATRAVQGIVRLVSQEGPPLANATWQLVPAPSNPHPLLNAAGERVPAAAVGAGGAPGARVPALRVPEQGPCVVGAVLDRDCDYVLEVPTVSGRHLRLEAQRRPDAKGGYSRLLLTDLGSTNGTRVNRRLIQPGKEVPLRPGDLVSVAVPDIAFEVQVLPPPTPAVAASNGTLASTAAALGAEAPPALEGAAAEAAAAQQAAAAAPPVVAALRLCGALEAAAATQGQFPPGGAVYADLPDRARQLMTAGRHDQAYVLLLAGAMQKPWSGGLWAQLANLERQRARRGGGGGSYGVARAFYAAAAACFAALTPAWAGGALRAGAERAEGLVRVYSSWGQMEQGLGHASAGRTVLRRGLAAAREHPAGVAAAGAPRLLVSWAAREWKAGDGAEAQRLCVEALEAEPTNPFALTQLASIEAAAGQTDVARRLFERALEADPSHAAALQALGRLEATTGSLSRARELFRRALHLQPRSAFVLQAWGVAEARRGSKGRARVLLQQAIEADPTCRPAWHALGKLEDEAGNAEAARQHYQAVLRLAPGSVPTLNSLACLERRAGQLDAAEAALVAALAAHPAHLPSLYELAHVRDAQGRRGEAASLRWTAARAASSRAAALKDVAALRLPAPAEQRQQRQRW